jgi:hypothetical protein
MARNPHTNKKGPGRPRWHPSEAERALVAKLRADGMTIANIAARIGVSEPTLVRECRPEIGETQPGKKLHIAAMFGDVDAGIRWIESYGRSARHRQQRIDLFARLAGPPQRT